jgi:hypothetical protein
VHTFVARPDGAVKARNASMKCTILEGAALQMVAWPNGVKNFARWMLKKNLKSK